MNTTTTQGNWNELKGTIKSKWGKFTDEEIEKLKGNLDQLTGTIQKAYGNTKDQAEQEYSEFKSSLHTATIGIKGSVLEAAHAMEDKIKSVAPATSYKTNERAKKVTATPVKANDKLYQVTSKTGH